MHNSILSVFVLGEKALIVISSYSTIAGLMRWPCCVEMQFVKINFKSNFVSEKILYYINCTKNLKTEADSSLQCTLFYGSF